MFKTLITILLVFLSAASNAQTGTSKAIIDTSTETVGRQMLTSTDNKAPKIPFKFSLGLSKYRNMCSNCHGKWGDGTEQGPPLMHPFYKPSHHADSAFYRAALKGVRAHHWKFGNMPPVAGVTSKDVDRILPFIRWLQQEKKVY